MSRISGFTTTCVEEKEEEVQEQQQPEQLVLRLRAVPNPPVDERPHVTWGAGVVDNEHMGRLKSNCCCIYTPPRRWDDPSTWEPEEHETEHCRGHTLPEKKKPKKDGDDDVEDGDENKENKPMKEEGEHGGCGCDHC